MRKEERTLGCYGHENEAVTKLSPVGERWESGMCGNRFSTYLIWRMSALKWNDVHRVNFRY